MKLTIVGCAGSYPSPESPASCYLLEHDGFVLVLDMGNGSLGSLQKHIDPRTIDAIALSHLHPDHCLDMPSLHVLAKYHPEGPYDTIGVWGPVDTESYLSRSNGVDGDPMTDKFAFNTWSANTPTVIGPFTVEPFAAKHPVPAFSLRVSAGQKVLAYTGDTGPHDAIVELARDADVFLSEASFVESAAASNPPDLHLTGLEAATYARQAGAKRLLITHVPAWTDRDEVARDVESAGFGGHIEFVRPGATYEL